MKQHFYRIQNLEWEGLYCCCYFSFYIKQLQYNILIDDIVVFYMCIVLTCGDSCCVAGAEQLLHLRLEMPGQLPPLVMEMLVRTENVCIP